LLHHLRQVYASHLKTSTAQQHELAQALCVLSAAGVRQMVPFKGAVLAHTLYPTAACRPMTDLDLWIAADEMVQAQSALEKCGYVQRVKAARPLTMQAQNYGEIQLHGTQPEQSLIELHWGVFPGEWLRRTAQVDQAGVWRRCTELTLLGHTVLSLSPEDQLLQLAVHQAVSHQMSAPHARGLVDVVRLARQHPLDWSAITARARAWQVSTAVWLVLNLASELTGWHDAESTLWQLAPSASRQWLLRRFVNPRAFLAGRMISNSWLRFAYLLSLVDSPPAMARLFIRTIWPETDWLERRYGRSGLGMHLQHLGHVLSGQV
nr:nucleotidyltransferase family protein [Thermoflexales bacterium]